MNRRTAWVRLVGAVGALTIAVVFAKEYGETSYVNLRWYYCSTMPKPGQTIDNVEIPLIPPCEFLLAYGRFLGVLPVLALVAGAGGIGWRKETVFAAVVELTWVLALALICSAIWFWAVPYTPGVIHLNPSRVGIAH